MYDGGKKYGEGTVCTVGMFDGVHRGHQLILRRLQEVAAERGLRPVAVTFDRHPRVVLGHTDNGFRLLTTNEERARLFSVQGLTHDDEVETVAFTPEVAQMSACEFYERELKGRLNVRVLLLGYDNMFGNRQKNDFDRLLAMPEVVVVKSEALVCDGVEISSTQIRNRLMAGDIMGANEMLGYSYSVEGRVVHGRGIGRTMGFPTANVEVDERMKAMPKVGVYAVRAWVEGSGKAWLGIANWGGRPTLDDEGDALEVNLFGYDGDLYGRRMRVAFEQRLRDIREFANLDELSHQLDCDRRSAQNILKP